MFDMQSHTAASIIANIIFCNFQVVNQLISLMQQFKSQNIYA